MTITKNPSGNYVIDTTTELKNLYPDHTVYINDVEKSTTLPYTAILTPAGVFTIKLILRSDSASYTETRCFLVDDVIECNVASYINNITKDERNVTNVPYLYYLLKEGTQEDNKCGCLCEDLKGIYQSIKDEIFKISC